MSQWDVWNAVQSHLWQKPIWISHEASSSWYLNMKAFTSLLSLVRCPREMGSLSCKVQRDTTAPGNHEMHQRQTPRGLIIKGRRVVESVITPSLSSQPVVESSQWVVVEKEICIYIYIFFFSIYIDCRGRFIWWDLFSCRSAKAIKGNPHISTVEE